MLRWIALSIALIASPVLADGVSSPNSPSTIGFQGAAVQFSGGGGGCSQATTFLARTSLTGSDVTNYTALICGLVSDGVWAKLDAFYVFAAPNTTVANLNLISTSYTLTTTTSPAFTVSQGYTPNGSSQFLNSGYIPSINGVNYTLNSASIFGWSGTNLRKDAAGLNGYFASSTPGAYINPWNSSIDSTANNLNDSTGANTFSPSLANGLFTASRLSSANYIVYRNATALGTQNDTSTALPSSSFYATVTNNSMGNTRLVSMNGWGGGLTATDVSNLYSRGSTFLSAQGSPQ